VRLRIEHSTTYVYERPVRFGRHRLVLRPREGHDLRVAQLDLRLNPAHRLSWIRDVFGNSIALVDWLEPSNLLSVVNDVVVERVAPFPGRDLHEPWCVPFPPQYEPMERAVTDVYARPSFVEDQPAIASWLREGLVITPTDAEGTIVALCELVGRTVAYQRRSERGVQGPGRTLTLRSGSCRDMATLMMEAARHLGVAARFASGYFHCAASMAGHASTHAWTEVYLPSLGWRGFDPTIGAEVSLRHIVTGVSSHPRGVMPVSGVYAGARDDCRSMEVRVRTQELGTDGIESGVSGILDADAAVDSGGPTTTD
jgi:transglutaminase-like putative cysteine protease